jgi:Ca2+-binding EF-hand superfamily protein
MMKRNLLIVTFAIAGSAFAVEKASTLKQPDKVTLASEKAKELLLLMDTDKTGRVSKQEWMQFMEAEFDRLDKGRKGELDLKELMHSGVFVRHFRSADVGK